MGVWVWILWLALSLDSRFGKFLLCGFYSVPLGCSLCVVGMGLGFTAFYIDI